MQGIGGGVSMKERFVCNERGFLLIEHLISLFVVGILGALIATLLQVMASYNVSPNYLTMHEVQTLATRIQNEARLASSLSAGDGELRLYFADSGDRVSFVARNNRMMRQVNGSGGEVATYNLRSMDVRLIDDGAARLRLVSMEQEVFNMYITLLVAGLTPIDSSTSVEEVCDGNRVCDEDEI